jgi:hypothetical protein
MVCPTADYRTALSDSLLAAVLAAAGQGLTEALSQVRRRLPESQAVRDGQMLGLKAEQGLSERAGLERA